MKFNLDPTDIAAYLIIAGCFALMFCGIDGEVKSILAVAAGWAFRRPIVEGTDKVRERLVGKKKE